MITLLHFTADWCQPCKKIKPIIDEYLEKNPEIQYVKIDIEEDFETAKNFDVMGIPTLITIENDSILNRHTGIADFAKIQSLFERVV